MISTSELIQRYTDYRKKMAEIRKRQALERADELIPYLADVGAAVAALRESGHGMPYLADLIGNKNRNFLYSALRAAGVEVETPSTTTTPRTSKKAGKVQLDTGYTISEPDENGTVEVVVGTDMFRLTPNAYDEQYDIPDAWLLEQDADRKALYRTILQELNGDA